MYNCASLGGVAEWSKAAVLKTVECNSSQGSNPCPTATIHASCRPHMRQEATFRKDNPKERNDFKGICHPGITEL